MLTFNREEKKLTIKCNFQTNAMCILDMNTVSIQNRYVFIADYVCVCYAGI